jgi:hypothetical protein
MKLTTTVGALVVIISMATGCRQSGEPEPAAAGGPVAPAPAQAPAPAGVIEIDGKTWTVMADVQCSVFPGPVVSIAGHAAEDEGIEIVVDYNGTEGPTGVSVIHPDGSVEWNAAHTMNFEIERQRVKGAGYFIGTLGGDTRQAEGRFDINCG